MRTPPVIAAALATVLLLPACNIGGNSTVAQENDRLRRQVLDLETKLQSLEGEREELRSKIAELTAAGRSSLSAEIIEAMPRVTKIEIDSLSGFTPTSSAKPGAEATGVVLYLSTRDGKDRFTQAVGTLKVEALGLPREVGTGAGPMLLGSATLTPTQLRDAYRSGQVPSTRAREGQVRGQSRVAPKRDGARLKCRDFCSPP